MQPNNILMGIHDRTVFESFESMASTHPVPVKELPDRIIYVSQPMPLTKGLPFLTDFSEARFGSSTHTGLIMPNVYRAPEVILEMGWSYPVDMWSFGMTVSQSLRTGLNRSGVSQCSSMTADASISSGIFFSQRGSSVPKIVMASTQKAIILLRWLQS
jgi:serine/threonine protein kinase